MNTVQDKKVWKDLAGYEGKYIISNYGDVCNVVSSKLLKQSCDKDGYLRVNLCDTRKHFKNFRVHRLVGITFLENTYNLPMINHIDGNTVNNYVENIEWCDASHNNKHRHILNPNLFKGENAPAAKLNSFQVQGIYKDAWEGKLKYREIAEKYNIDIGEIYNIKFGRQWTCITKHSGKTSAGIHKGENVKTSKLTEEQVIEIYNLAWNSGLSNADLGRRFNVNKENIRAIKSGKTWKHITNNLTIKQQKKGG